MVKGTTIALVVVGAIGALIAYLVYTGEQDLSKTIQGITSPFSNLGNAASGLVGGAASLGGGLLNSAQTLIHDIVEIPYAIANNSAATGANGHASLTPPTPTVITGYGGAQLASGFTNDAAFAATGGYASPAVNRYVQRH